MCSSTALSPKHHARQRLLRMTPVWTLITSIIAPSSSLRFGTNTSSLDAACVPQLRSTSIECRHVPLLRSHIRRFLSPHACDPVHPAEKLTVSAYLECPIKERMQRLASISQRRRIVEPPSLPCAPLSILFPSGCIARLTTPVHSCDGSVPRVIYAFGTLIKAYAAAKSRKAYTNRPVAAL
jgi:hypothetical protein